MAVETKVVISGQDKTKAAVASVRKSLDSLSKSSLLAGTNLAGIGSAISVVGFTNFIKSGIDTLDMLDNLSIRTGVAATTLAAFQTVAKLSDTSLEALGKGLNKLNLFMAQNAKEAKQLGISAKDPAEAFIELASTLSSIEDVQLRNAVAQRVLGKSYEELLPALTQGEEALRKQIAAGRDYANITPEAVKQAAEFNDKLDILSIKASSVSANFVSKSGLLDSLLRIAEAMEQGSKNGGILQGVLQGVLESYSELGTSRFVRALPVVGGIATAANLVLGNRGRGSQVQTGKIKPAAQTPAQNLAQERAACLIGGGEWINGKCVFKKAGGGQSDAKREISELLKAQADYQETLRTNAAKFSNAQIDAALADNQREYDQKLVNAETYYARLKVLEEQRVNNEIKLLSERLAVQQAVLNGKAAASEKEKAKAEISDINTEIDIARSKLETFKKDTAADLLKAQTEQAKADFDLVKSQIDNALEDLRNREQQISNRVELGLPEISAEQQINEVRRETVTVVDELIFKLQEIVSLNPRAFGAEAGRTIENYKNNLATTTVAIDRTAVSINASIENEFGSLFNNLITGSESAEKAVLSMLKNITATMAQEASRRLGQQFFSSLFGGGSGEGGGVGGLFSGLLSGGIGGGQFDGGGGFFAGISNWFNGFADGGYTGDGGKYQPKGIVHGGEFVFNKQATSRMGVATLSHLHNMLTGAHLPQAARYAYADGGAVNLPSPTGGVVRNTNIIAIDKNDIQDAAWGGSDSRLINKINLNRSAIRAALGI